MSHRDTDDLARWLEAEQAESWDEADELFAAIASRHLPLAAEPAGLAARIMAAVPGRARARWFGTLSGFAGARWVRATVAAAVAVLGASLGAVSPGQIVNAAAASVEALAWLAHGASAGLSAAVSVWGGSWALLVNLGRAASLLASSGAAPLVIAGNLLLACAAFAGLSRLLSLREECS